VSITVGAPMNDESRASQRRLARHSSIILTAIGVVTIVLVGFDLGSWLIHSPAAVLELRALAMIFEICLAGIVGAVLLHRERHLSVTLKGEDDVRKTAEQRIWLQAAALQAAANAIVITDVTGSILWVNRAFSDLTGYSEEESIGENPRFLKSWEHDQSFYRNLWATILSGKVWHGEIKNRKKNGTLYTEEMTITPLRCSSGEVTHFIAIKQDVSEKKKLESQYRQAQKMEAVGRLAGGVAHDFNNILSVINGYADLSMENVENAIQTTKYLQDIKTAATRAASLTKQLLAFSRQQVVFPRVVSVNDVIANILDMLQRLVGDDVLIAFRRSTSLGAIEADVGQLEQVLMNLIVNARDAMPDGGEIIIETCDVDLDEGYQLNHEPILPGSYVMIAVSDSGCGMDETTKARLFEPFFTTKPPGRGTGLGLSTVYGIVKQSGGYIWVYSEPGSGTIFKIFLPRVGQVPETPVRSVRRDVLLSGSETILVVEDDENLRELLMRTLQSAGYNTLQANTAEVATELIAAHPGKVQLLLTDVVMPKTSGIRLFEALQRSFPELKAAFMSGYAAEMLSRQRFLPNNAVFLEKPFDKETLLTTVHAVLHDNLQPAEKARVFGATSVSS
jgi:two-component system, cell cycle sensor histidine kinase and response regulator CckA